MGGALVYFALDPFAPQPVIVAAGAISGMFAAVILLMYHSGQLGALGKKGPWPVIGFWFAFMLFFGLLSGDNMAWQAHAGGYVSGVALLMAMRKGLIKL